MQHAIHEIIEAEMSLRTLAVRRDAGRWICDPQELYDFVVSKLQDRQVGIEELFWLMDEKLPPACIWRISRAAAASRFAWHKPTIHSRPPAF